MKSNYNQQGWGLVETLLTLGTISALSVGIYMAFSPTDATAKTKTEQEHIRQFVERVGNAYGLLNNYSEVSNANLITDKVLPSTLLSGGELLSSWSSPIVFRPYQVNQPNDSFVVSYTNTPKEICTRLASAGSSGAYDVLVNGTSVLSSSRTINPISTAALCEEGSELSFVFTGYGNTAYAADPLDLPPPPVSITPPNQSPETIIVGDAQDVANATVTPSIPPTQTGPVPAPSIPIPGVNTPSLPNPAPTPSPSTPSTPIKVISKCQDGYEDRFSSCPSGQYGRSIERQLLACELAGKPGVSEAWVPLNERVPKGWNYYSSGTCAACPVPSTGIEYQWIAASETCPAGQLGSKTWQKEQVRSRSVSYNCPLGTIALPAPNYGAWSGWSDTGATQNVSNTCATACVLPSPSSQTQTESRTATQTLSCPAGQSGSIVQNRQETRSQSRSASCPAPTGSYVWGSWSSWSNWTATGAWNTASNTCVPSTPVTPITHTCQIKGPGSVESEKKKGCEVLVRLKGETGVVNAKFILTGDPAVYNMSWSGDCTGTGATCTNSSNSASWGRPSRDYTVYWTATHIATGAVQSGTILASYGEK